MAKLKSLLSLPPLPESALDTPYPFPVPPDVLQLQTDTINVLEGRVDITTFEPDYQIKIKNYWRFSATLKNKNSINPVAVRTNDTLDII